VTRSRLLAHLRELPLTEGVLAACLVWLRLQ
jgi:hypothetical protein